jgi:hypothetical protein
MPEELSLREQTLEALAGLIVHLHVPRSFDSIMVPKEYNTVRTLIGDFGWSNQVEVLDKLRRALTTSPSEEVT